MGNPPKSQPRLPRVSLTEGLPLGYTHRIPEGIRSTAMRRKALLIVAAIAVVVSVTVALLFQFSYLEARLNTQSEELRQQRESLLVALQVAVPPAPEILHATLTLD